MLRSAACLRGGGGPVVRYCSGGNRPSATTRGLQPLARRRSLCAFANHSDSRRDRERDGKGDTILAQPNAIPPYHRRLSNGAFPPSTNSSRGGGGGGGAILGIFAKMEGKNQLASVAASRRQLSTMRGLPPRRTLREKIFAGAVVVVLAAWGLLFGAITLVLLPFVGIGLFLLRRNFRRGGISREVVAMMARKMTERQGQYPAGGGGGGGDGWGPIDEWMKRAPTEGVMSAFLAKVLGGGIRGMKLVGVLRSEVERRALRNPGLASALGGDIASFSHAEMSTVGTVGGSFGPGGGGGGGGVKGSGPSRVIKARFRFVGRRGGAGWAEVDVTDWEDAGGEDGTGGMEYDRVFVTLDSGKTFDLTNDVAGAGGGKVTFSHRQGRPTPAGKARRKGSSKEGAGRPVETEFRDK